MADSSLSSARKSGGAQRSRQAKAGEKSGAKMFRVLLLLLCCALAGYFFWSNIRIMDDSEAAINRARMEQPSDAATEAEKQDIDTAEEGLQNMTRASSNAMQLALLAEVQGRYPIDVPTSLIGSPSVTYDIAPVEPEPPYVTVVAIMITDDDRIALVNVAGEEQGKLVRQGTRFSDGTAQITKIEEKGVTFTWRRRSYEVSL